MKIFIIFVGLIAHVNQPGFSFDDTAVLPRFGNHQARMSVDAEAILNPDDTWVKAQCGDAAKCVIDLTGYAVRLENTTMGFCSKKKIAKAVPELKTVAPQCGSLKRAVRERDTLAEDGRFAAFVDYGSGELTVESYFGKMIQFGAKAPHCSACEVRYEGNLRGEEATFVFRRGTETHELRVAGNSTVTVSNRPPSNDPRRLLTDQADHHVDSHFSAYYWLMNDCAAASPTIVGNCEKDPNLICQFPFMPLADCTNSQFP